MRQFKWLRFKELQNMKFSSQDCVRKECFGMGILEYCYNSENYTPLDCAVVKFRNNRYPWKINHGFHEAFFILEGECFVEFENETVQLSKHDFFVIEPEKEHTTYAEFADIVVCCTPPFDIKKVTFLESKISEK